MLSLSGLDKYVYLATFLVVPESAIASMARKMARNKESGRKSPRQLGRLSLMLMRLVVAASALMCGT